MYQVIEATFEKGVFKPDVPPGLSESTRVRLLVETVSEAGGEAAIQHGWSSLEQLWRDSTFDSQGDRLSRDQLHERR